MAYNDFSLDALIGQFGLRVREESAYFAAFAPVPISDHLRETLDENVPVAVEVSTEKARSELIIMPVLMEVRRQFGRRISVFSGVEFNVDSVWGVVTTGSLWKFLRLTENIVGVDVVERPIQQIEHVVGIFVGVIGEAMAGAGDKNEEPAAP